MALTGKAVLAIWNGISPQAEDEFVRWHVREHIPERVALPGFLRGRRYVAAYGKPKYFNFYETADVAALSSPTYLERLNTPSNWTKAVVAHFNDTSRTICTVRRSVGLGDGAAVLTARLRTQAEAQDFIASVSNDFLAVSERTGIVAIHLLQGDQQASTRPTAEKQLRRAVDEVVEWILLVEAVDSGTLAELSDDSAFVSGLVRAGAEPDSEIGIYNLQFALLASQIPSVG